MTTDTKKRVKLYILNEQRQWDDKGTGHVTAVCNNDKLRGVTLIVKSETDGELTASVIKFIKIKHDLFLIKGSTLLESRILTHTAYQKQQVC